MGGGGGGDRKGSIFLMLFMLQWLNLIKRKKGVAGGRRTKIKFH